MQRMPKAVDAAMTTSPEDMYHALAARLGDVLPDFEIRHKAGVAAGVNRLKAERGAVILGHNYMEPALFHSVCDFRGDSLELSRLAATVSGDPIVFCGVRFMAETAKILNPDKTVLLPTAKGGCSLAESITAADVRRLRKRFPGVPVVTYINTYADVKAETDICCTSGNAVKVVESLDADRVIFLPDEFLAKNVARETGKRIIFPTVNGATSGGLSGNGKSAGDSGELQYEMIGWRGRCEVHEQFTTADIATVRRQFPDVLVLAHPECPPDVVEAADFAGSTSAMIRAVQESDAARYLLLTECSMADNIIAENPAKEMVRLCSVRCPHMNEITLENVRDALLHDHWPVDVPEPTRTKARASIERMLEIG
ncbi:MAG TPA: quinolinate synthase NadA [Longimicrobiales bacterium]|nr:quinolinate synthase NadA [Longimicrobiales bacterium]